MGAGIHGGFGNTRGNKDTVSIKSPPVKSTGDVRYSRKKTEEYLLNKNHKVGGSKAKFMEEILGYGKKDAKKFHDNIVKELVNKQPTKTINTDYGTKYTYNIKLKGINGKSVNANVVVIIQKDKGRITHKIVTIYPDKKRGKDYERIR